MQEYDPLERTNVYTPSTESTDTPEMVQFKRDSGNTEFRRSKLTWVALFFILIFYPGISVLFVDDPTVMLKQLQDQTLLMVVLISTIMMQWLFFTIIYFAVFRERTGLAGLGLDSIRASGNRWLLYAGWAIAFVLAANLILSGLAWVLAQIGLPMPGEIMFLVPTDFGGRIVWVIVSFTAGFCEETMFRGYLMTRLKLVFGIKGWTLPIIISGIVFGACHAYQGWPGFIVLSVYGAMFGILYVRTGSLWPCVIAHFLQDFSALFFPR